MSENAFGFEYSWDDLKPIRALSVTMSIGQAIGALSGAFLLHTPEWIANVVAGAGIATFPGYVAGLLVQRAIRPVALNENRTMVYRLRLVAAAISTITFFVVN